MNPPDPFADLKQRQREMWASFTPTAMFTTPVAGQLVKFAQIAPGQNVLDVGTGTGVVAITAARAGARVTGLDLTPELLDQARENARIAQMPHIVWTEGDAENLPYPDASFDVVVSQFGHMFAPRPEIAVTEMRRVLKSGGTFALIDPVRNAGKPSGSHRGLEVATSEGLHCMLGETGFEILLSHVSLGSLKAVVRKKIRE